MNLPQNGKIVVIDNEPLEAEPLLEIFGKNRIPYVYFTGEINKLPAEGECFDDVRIVFLDINLTNGAPVEAIPAQLGNTIKRIIKPGTPYIAAIWSNNQDDHRATLKDLFENREPQISPISMTFLKKSDFFRIEPNQGYVLDPDRPNILNEIQSRIDECLNEVDSVKLLIEWENCISYSLSKTIFNISNIVDNDGYWNDNLKHVYYKLAHAQLGKNMKDKTNNELGRAALNTISSTFYDKLESRISDISLDESLDIKNAGIDFLCNINQSKIKLRWRDLTYFLFIDGTQKSQNKTVEGLKANNNPNEIDITQKLKARYNQISPKLNFELLFSKEEKAPFHPGNVYVKNVSGLKKRNLLFTYFPKIKEKENNGKFKIKTISDFRFVEVECTPACDYSQSKRLRYRLISGILFKNIDYKQLDPNLDSIYKEIPAFQYKNDVYRLVFDYRLFKTISVADKADIGNNSFIFRLKHELVVDIQARISSHINRPGIITVA